MDAAHTRLTPDQRLECGRAANSGLANQGVLGVGQDRFDAAPPLFDGAVGAPLNDDGRTESCQRFGTPIVLEGILQSQWQNDSLFQAAGEMSHTGLNEWRPFARHRQKRP